MKKRKIGIYASAIAMCLSCAATAGMSNVFAADLINSTFESGIDSWEGRGSASVSVSSDAASDGSKSAYVSGRTDSWNGISRNLSASEFVPGQTYSLSADVMTKDSNETFKMTLQYSTGSADGGMFGGMGGSQSYDAIASTEAKAGEWAKLSNASYTIPEGATNMVLYIETDSSKSDFYVDNIVVSSGSGSITPTNPTNPTTPSTPKGNYTSKQGDADSNNKIDTDDIKAVQEYILGKTSDVNFAQVDFDGDNVITVSDLATLRTFVINYKEPETPPSSSGKTPKETMEAARQLMTLNVPSSATQDTQTGKLEHISYPCKFTGRNKKANVLLPPNYSTDKKYPVLYVNHGIFGSENDMLGGWKIENMSVNLAKSGEAEEMIIVFTSMYTSKTSDQPQGMSFNVETTTGYDNFLYDLTESLMPYIESHYSCKVGRENTAISGFSMGGREALYIGVMRPDLFGYIGAMSPAPGVTPGSDMFMNHPGNMKESEFKITDPDNQPYVWMIAGGTNDSVVGTFPEQYHKILTTNGQDHIWLSVPGAGHDASCGTPLMYNFLRAIFKT